jgi:hypothetical protein
MREFEPALMDDGRSGIRETLHNEALRGRALESFPPLYRPLPGDAAKGEHSFRVSQRFVPRVRHDTAIAQITP